MAAATAPARRAQGDAVVLRWSAGVVGAAMLCACSGQEVLNALTPSSGYKLSAAVLYDDANRLRLDVYAPPRARNAPVVVFLYGGRWSAGSRSEYRFVGQALASKGFVAVIPDYRVYPVARFPVFVEDAARALRWTRDIIGRYGGDPRQLFVMGHSSGAHMAALLALDPGWLQRAGLPRGALRGMIGLAGAYDFMPITAPDLREIFGPPDRFAASQPVNFADGANPPLLLLHGANDDTVDVRNTRNLARAVAHAGGPVEVLIYPRLSHGWIVGTLGAPLRGQADVLDQVAEFVRRRSREPLVPKPAIESRKLQ